MSEIKDLMAHDWADAMRTVWPNITEMGQFVRRDIVDGCGYLPAGDAIFRAFHEPMGNVKVLITGQDPYPTPGHAMGLSFSVSPHVRPIPRSLHNIYAELRDDLGIGPAESGHLTARCEPGGS